MAKYQDAAPVRLNEMTLYSFAALPQEITDEAIARGEDYLGFDWGCLPLDVYMQFAENGNRTNYEDLNFRRRIALNCLVCAELAEDEGRFVKDIANGLWAICDESTWVIPAHNGGGKIPELKKPNIDLFSAQTAAQLALAAWVLRDKLDSVSTGIAARVRHEVKKRVCDPFLQSDYWWMGFSRREERPSNWTPWCTSTCLAACFYAVEDDKKRKDTLAKALKILKGFMEGYPDDGGCDEGAEYWRMSAGCAFDCAELIFIATRGELNLFKSEKLRAMAAYIYRVNIFGNCFVNFADCSAKADKGGVRSYLYGVRTGDERLADFAAEDFAEKTDKTDSMNMNLLHKLMIMGNASKVLAHTGGYTATKTDYIKSLQLYVVRSDALSVAVKGGTNGDNHNHNDVGSFMIYKKDTPVIIDAGVGSYSKETFSDGRYGIWTMQSAYHNLPTVNGVMQHEGASYRSKEPVKTENGIRLDISGAYPPEAGIIKLERELSITDNVIIIADSYELERNNELFWTLMCAEKPVMIGTKLLIGRCVLEWEGELSVKTEFIPTKGDAKLEPVWGEGIYRIKLESNSRAEKGRVRIAVKGE